MAFIKNASITQIRMVSQSSLSENPPAGSIWLFHHTINGLSLRLPNGSEVTIATGSSATAFGDLTDYNNTGVATGSIIVFDGTDYVALAVGADGTVLTADSSQPSGVGWQSVSAQDAEILAWMGI